MLPASVACCWTLSRFLHILFGLGGGDPELNQVQPHWCQGVMDNNFPPSAGLAPLTITPNQIVYNSQSQYVICLTGRDSILNIWAYIQLGTCHNPQVAAGLKLSPSPPSLPPGGSSQMPSSASHHAELYEVSSNPSSRPLRSLGFKAFGMSTSPCNLISSCKICKKVQNESDILCPLVTKEL